MGYDLHITRREFHADEGDDITHAEWDAFVASDDSLISTEDMGDGMMMYMWSGPSQYSEPWLMWGDGCVSTKYPDRALILKMIEIASALSANVQGDDGERYESEADIPGDWDDSLDFG